MQGREKVRSIADGANRPGQEAAPVQLQRDDSTLAHRVFAALVLGGYKMTVLVAARPCPSPCMMYVSSLSLVVPMQEVSRT